MAKFGSWKNINGVKQMPLKSIVSFSKDDLINLANCLSDKKLVIDKITMLLSRDDLVKLINCMNVEGTFIINKTQVMDEAYKRINNKDFLFLKSEITPLANEMFNKLFSEYDVC